MRTMKRYSALLSVALLLGSCQQAPPVIDTPPHEAATPTAADKPANYQALPGRAATSSTPSETTTAFEFAAASLGVKTEGSPAEASTTADSPARPTTFIPQQQEMPTPPRPMTPPISANSAPPIPDPRPVDAPSATAPIPEPTAASSSFPTNAGEARKGAAGISATQTKSSAADAGYAVQVINGTNGRLFVEAQDDSGNIFPFGFMYAGQRIASRPQDPRPISGQLTIIVRDPDQPGAPELRRYRVQPAENYMGRTLGVTILPGGRYRAAVDGKVYYSTPEQDTPGQG